jgi:hypothetical protein
MLIENKYIIAPDNEDYSSKEWIEYNIEVGSLRKIYTAPRTETQWPNIDLVEGEDFYVVQGNFEPDVSELAYPINPVFTLEEMIHAYNAGFELHKTFSLIEKNGPRNLYFKSHYSVDLENYTPF